MDGPLSPLSPTSLNIRSPGAARIGQMETATATPTAQKATIEGPDEEEINWDDPPSSPFMSEVPESRTTSREWNKAAVDPEIDAIFEDAAIHSETPVKGFVPLTLDFDLDNEKENLGIGHVTESFAKRSSPVAATPARVTTSPERPQRDADTISMPPPSTAKRAARPSPDKQTPHAAARDMSATPLPSSRHESYEQLESRSMQHGPPMSFDGANDIEDETNVDDTCFSTFSAVPDMTLFAKLGNNGRTGRHSPQKDGHVCGSSDNSAVAYS